MMEELKKNELKKNELSETETAGVSGGWYDLYEMVLEDVELERAKKQTGAHAHETGASGSW